MNVITMPKRRNVLRLQAIKKKGEKKGKEIRMRACRRPAWVKGCEITQVHIQNRS